MRYYIWHDEGCCDNATDCLEEARRIEKELLDDGHIDAYIADEGGNVIDETFVESEVFRMTSRSPGMHQIPRTAETEALLETVAQVRIIEMRGD